MSEIFRLLNILFFIFFGPFILLYEALTLDGETTTGQKVEVFFQGILGWFISLLIAPIFIILCFVKGKSLRTRFWTNDVLHFETAEHVCDILEYCVQEKGNDELAEEWWYFLDEFISGGSSDPDIRKMGQSFDDMTENYKPGDSPFTNDDFAKEVEVFVNQWRKKLNITKQLESH